MYSTFAFGKKSKETGFEKIEIERNVCGEDDVVIQLKYCGVCHSDVHVADNDMGRTHYPCVPGYSLYPTLALLHHYCPRSRAGRGGDQGWQGCDQGVSW